MTGYGNDAITLWIGLLEDGEAAKLGRKIPGPGKLPFEGGLSMVFLRGLTLDLLKG